MASSAAALTVGSAIKVGSDDATTAVVGPGVWGATVGTVGEQAASSAIATPEKLAVRKAMGEMRRGI